jgi:hypothetical protein
MGETPRGFESHWVQTKLFFLPLFRCQSCLRPSPLPLWYVLPDLSRSRQIVIFALQFCARSCREWAVSTLSFYSRGFLCCQIQAFLVPCLRGTHGFHNETACPSGLRRLTRNQLGVPAQVQILLLSIPFFASKSASPSNPRQAREYGSRPQFFNKACFKLTRERKF